MHVLDEKLRAPEFRVDAWLQGGPLAMADLRGKVVLVDFWDYACVNCLHTLSYLRAWHNRYAAHGLVIVGIHAPEFEFARDENRVRGAVERLKLPYAVALDNGFRTWDAFANRAWPGKYLIDQQGYIRALHHGEGAYDTFEALIQQLLLDNNPALSFPPVLEPVRDIDRPDAVCLRPTPELYLGTARGRLGSQDNLPPNRPARYEAPAEQAADTIYLEGYWQRAREAVESTAAGRIHVAYVAARVNLVMAAESPVTVRVLLDGDPLGADQIGEDVALAGGSSVIHVQEPRMYSLVAHPGFERHRLTLAVTDVGLRAYAFTFVSSCTADGIDHQEEHS